MTGLATPGENSFSEALLDMMLGGSAAITQLANHQPDQQIGFGPNAFMGVKRARIPR